MLKTFNCGVGFCLIANKNNTNLVKILKKITELKVPSLYIVGAQI